MPLLDETGIMRTIRSIRAHVLCRELPDCLLAELEALCHRRMCCTQPPEVPESVRLLVSPSRELELAGFLQERSDREILLESIELEQHHRKERAEEKAPT